MPEHTSSLRLLLGGLECMTPGANDLELPKEKRARTLEPKAGNPSSSPKCEAPVWAITCETSTPLTVLQRRLKYCQDCRDCNPASDSKSYLNVRIRSSVGKPCEHLSPIFANKLAPILEEWDALKRSLSANCLPAFSMRAWGKYPSSNVEAAESPETQRPKTSPSSPDS